MTSTISKIFLFLGGLFGFVNGIADIVLNKPLATLLFGLNFGIGAPLIVVLGVLGLIGGLIVLYFGLAKPTKMYALIGSILALIGICGFALLALIGAFLMEE